MNIPNHNYDDRELLEFIGRQESQTIKWGNTYADSLQDRIANGDQITGFKLPWSKTHDTLRFREGDISIWAGMNGHKKSMLLGQVMMWCALEAPVGVASFEMSVVDTMERLVTQAAGCRPSKQFAYEWAQWNDQHIAYYDQMDTVPASRVLGAIFYMAKELGCKNIMIDSLTKIRLPSNDKDAEKRFIDTLAATAMALGVHIHLVAHVRKPPQGGEDYIPTKFDVRGAGELTDLVDNVFIVWSDKRRAKIKTKIFNNSPVTDKEQEYFDSHPDQRLICPKQRHGKWEGQIALWFDDDSLQFVPGSNSRPMLFNMDSPELF